ncbi:MAG TPA: hypothetical protein VFZ73_19545 [Gemmatimonadaceae bacterium]
MYPIVLGLHNLARWLVLLTGVWAVFLMWRGWLGRRQWTVTESRATAAFVGSLDLQLVLGLLLFAVFSPLTRQAFSDIGGAMRDAPVRYFLVEHPLIMVLAVAAAHIGRARIRKAATDVDRFQKGSILLGLSLAALAGFIPWARPFMPSF